MDENMKNNPIVEKSKRFAIRIIRLYQHLGKTKKEFVMSKQLLRCGTSIGANVREAPQHAQSKKDFIAKMYIALKETEETEYWLELFVETDYLTQDEFNSIYRDAVELLSLLIAIIKSAKKS